MVGSHDAEILEGWSCFSTTQLGCKVNGRKEFEAGRDKQGSPCLMDASSSPYVISPPILPMALQYPLPHAMPVPIRLLRLLRAGEDL